MISDSHNDFKVGDQVVRLGKHCKRHIWEVIGISNVFTNSCVCRVDGELLHHFDFDSLRLATDDEVSYGARIDYEV